MNIKKKKKGTVYEHLIMYGFLVTYTNWLYHGETPVCIYETVEEHGFFEDEGGDIDGMIEDAFGLKKEDDDLAYSDELNNIELNKETTDFLGIIECQEKVISRM